MRLVHLILSSIIKFIATICLIIVSVVLFLITLIYFLRFSFPEFDTISSFIDNLPELRLILLIILGVGAVGIATGSLLWRNQLVFFWKRPIEEILTYIFVSFFFSYFFWISFSVFNSRGVLGYIFLFISFLIYIPLLVNFFALGIYTTFRKPSEPSDSSFLQSSVGLAILRLVFILIVVFANILSSKYVNVKQVVSQKQVKEKRQKESYSPKIIKIEPRVVYHSTKIVITGSGLTWRNKDDLVRLEGTPGKIATDLWTDTKIIITVPLHWKLGEHKLWITRTFLWKGKNLTVKSNVVSIRLISRFPPWDEEDDLYFQQLPHLDKETLLLNGHRP